MSPLVLGLLWLVPALPLHTALHEMAHALVGLAQGRKLMQFHPWPGMLETRFVWGWTWFEPHEEVPRDAWIWSAPALLDWAWVIGAAIAAHALLAHPFAHAIACAELAAALIDFGTWTLSSGSQTGDAHMVAEVSGVDLGALKLGAVVCWLGLALSGALLALPWGVQ